MHWKDDSLIYDKQAIIRNIMKWATANTRLAKLHMSKNYRSSSVY